MAFLQFHATHFAGPFVTPDTLTDSDTFTILSSRLDCYKYCKIFASTAAIVFPVWMPRLARVASHAALLRH